MSNAAASAPPPPADAPPPLGVRFGILVDWCEEHLGRHRLAVGAVLFAALVLLFGAGGSNHVGGDQRALADLGWWMARSGEASLENHPFYRDPAKKEFGYWAVRLDDGRVASVYPTGVLLFTVPGHWVLGAVGMADDLERSRATMRVALSLWMALALLGLWRVLAERWGEVTGLIAVALLGAGSSILGTLVQAPWSMTGSTICQAFSLYFGREALREPAARSATRCAGFALAAAGFFAAWAAVCRPTLGLWTIFFGAWIALRLRGRALWALAGAIVAGIGGAALNYATSGSVAGLYFAKGAGVGFGGDAASIARGFAGILVSPGRGLLVFTPWAILAVAGFVLAAKRWGGDSFLLLNAAYVAAMFVVLGTFRMWHGSHSAGPRLQCDLILGVAILAAPALAWLARRWWGWVVVAALAVPSIVVQHRIQRMPDSLPEVHWPAGKFDEYLWRWREGTFLWFWTEGGTMREILGIAEKPTLAPNGTMDPAVDGERHVLGGVTVDAGDGQREPRFAACSRRTRWVFETPEGYAGKPLWIVLEFVPGTANYRHDMVARIDCMRLKRFAWFENFDPTVVAFRVEGAPLSTGRESVLEIEELRPAQGMYGTGWMAWRRVTILPEDRTRVDALPPGSVRE